MFYHDADRLIPCVSDNLLVVGAQAIQNAKLAYITDTGKYIKLNDDALKILELCDGRHTVREVLDALRQEYTNDLEVREVAVNFIIQLEKAGIIQFLERKRKRPRKINPEVKLSNPIQHIYIEVTNACNLKCKHCYNDSGVKLKRELTTEEIKKILDECAKLNVLNIVLTGGEPLLRKDLFKVIEYARKKPMSVTLFTNGTLVDEKIAHKLKQQGVLRILVSLDGASERTHDAFRGVKGAFKKTINAIKLLKNEGLHVTVNVCINKFNKGEIPQLLKLIKRLDVNDYILGPLYSAGRAEGKIEELGISIEEYRKILTQIRVLEKRIFGMEKIIVTESRLGHCGIGTRSLTIKADGTIIPCVSASSDRFSLGNIRKESIEHVWNNSRLLNELREIDLRNAQKCGCCEHFSYCRGGCRLNAYQMFHDLFSPDPYACAYYSYVAQDIVIKPLDEVGEVKFEVR